MAKKLNIREVLHNHTKYKCCLLDEYKYLAKQIEQNKERMKKIKPLLELADVKEV